MRDIEKIKKELSQYQMLLDSAPAETGNPDLLANYLGQLNKAASRTSFMIAEVVKLKYTAMAAIQDKFSELLAKMPPSAQKDYVKAHTADENALMEWVVSLNETTKTQSKNIITMLSYEKQQLVLERTGV